MNIQETIERLEQQRVSWNIARETIACITESVSLIDNPTVLEIGTYNGYSALWFATVAKHVTSIECEEARFRESQKNCADVSNITLVHGDACTLLKQWQEEQKHFDAILIDGKKSEYVSYLEAALQLISPHGIIFVDNTISHKDKLDDFFTLLNEQSHITWKETSLGDGMIIIKQKV